MNHCRITLATLHFETHMVNIMLILVEKFFVAAMFGI
jgi:hypothetical protein